jgi:pyruvate/2-oxoglutarate dehydrogenase complex dihydrolipoamide dehydrogenase (E3) component
MIAPTPSAPPMQPWDAHNQRLLAHVHPPDWTNPSPAPRYNLVVIGGGTAGLVGASIAAGLGGKVALIERHLLGGDCLNVGCVPSKALIRAARAATEARQAGRFGVRTGEVTVDFAAVMERMRRLRADISPHDSAARFRDLGVDVFIGDGRFVGPDSIQVGDQVLRFSKAVIATGARAAAPPIPGIAEVPYLTNETLFSLTELPRRFGIIGAGPIGCEMAQCFARFGSEVFLVETDHGVLPKEDRDAAGIVRQALLRDGVKILGHGKEVKVSPGEDGIHLRAGSGNGGYDIAVDQLLVAAGRAPNVEGLGLESAGVSFDKSGVTVDDRLRTTNPKIYACGDVCSRFQFTHAADFMARMVVQNALFKGRKRASALLIPWSTYTSPEIAQVGLNAAEAEAQGVAVDTYTQEMAKVDRAILDDETEGFVRVHVAKGTGRIVGATIVAAHAGEMISELTLAMNGKLGLGRLGASIHPYPTQTEAVRKLGDLYSRTRLTPFVKRLFNKWLAWQR